MVDFSDVEIGRSAASVSADGVNHEEHEAHEAFTEQSVQSVAELGDVQVHQQSGTDEG